MSQGRSQEGVQRVPDHRKKFFIWKIFSEKLFFRSSKRPSKKISGYISVMSQFFYFLISNSIFC